MNKLAKKTLFITGASRGIGLAIALRFARDGNNIVLVAKEDEDNNLNKATEKIKQVGGQVLALDVDLCNADEIKQPVTKAASYFNTIDVLINDNEESLARMGAKLIRQAPTVT